MTTELDTLVMCEPLIALLAIFFGIDLIANYSTWKSEAKFPGLNHDTIREYKSKCWRSLIPLLIIIWVYFYT